MPVYGAPPTMNVPQQQTQSAGLNAFGLNPRSKTYASDTYAALTREQWQNYLNNFVPLENQLIEYAMSPDTVTNAVQSARQDVSQSFSQQRGIQQRQLRSLGVTLDQDEQKAVDRESALSKSLADVNAGNQVATRVRDRQQSLLGNPAPSINTGG